MAQGDRRGLGRCHGQPNTDPSRGDCRVSRLLKTHPPCPWSNCPSAWVDPVDPQIPTDAPKSWSLAPIVYGVSIMAPILRMSARVYSYT